MEMGASNVETKISKEKVAAYLNVGPRHHHALGGW